MHANYRYGHQPRNHRLIGISLLIAVIAVLIGGYTIARDIRSTNTPVEGSSRQLAQVADEDTTGLVVDEPYFRMELPPDWKEVGRKNTAQERSITWQATQPGEDNRSLTLYIDVIPSSLAVNRFLPVRVNGARITYGTLSDNCATFTGGGTLDATQATQLKPAPAKWRDVDFLCNLPNVVDNQVGVGAPGIFNGVDIAGPQAGKHRYFFIYTDRNHQPEYRILYQALNSFEVK